MSAVRSDAPDASDWKLASVYANPAWFDRADRIRFVVRVLLAAVVLVSLLLLLAGMRQERSERTPRLSNVAPDTALYRQEKPARPAAGQPLSAGDTLVTGAQSSLTAVFGDGTAFKIGPETQWTIRTLDEGRNGRSDRAFFLHQGILVLRIGQAGRASQHRVCTPNAIVTGTPGGCRISYDPISRRTRVEVSVGVAILRNADGQVLVSAGQSAQADDDEPARRETLSPSTRRRLSETVQGLRRLESSNRALTTLPRQLWNAFSSLTRPLGFRATGFDPRGSDPARRAQTLLALKQLGQEIATQNGDVPERINPVTLAPLGLPAELRERLLSTLSGMVIDRFERNATGFSILVHGRDSQRTAYRLTEGGASEIEEKIRL